jgi:CDP-diacylglycerol---glycerol-3-phosphate 3-phosphatidyltransferase
LASIYDLKPRFQALLRPLSDALVRAKLSANDVTLGALLLSAAHGAWLALMPGSAWPLLLLPVTLFVRMAMNAIDGMMAKEHGQASAAGAVLNALSDVIADAALYLPFALIPGVNAPLVVLVVVAGVIGEMAGARAIGQSATQLCRSVRQERSRPCLWPTRDPTGPRAFTRIVPLSRE